MKNLTKKQTIEIESFLKNYKSKNQFKFKKTYLYQFLKELKKL